jgi:hypothetical protein
LVYLQHLGAGRLVVLIVSNTADLASDAVLKLGDSQVTVRVPPRAGTFVRLPEV